jgi:TPR repeat protein
MYEYGRGVPVDYSEAARWYRKAADLGDANGMSYLGSLYQAGKGVERSLPKAIALFQKAVALHNDAAALYMGFLYQNGSGVPKDVNRARSLYTEASRSHKPQIASSAQHLLSLLPQEEVARTNTDSNNYVGLFLGGVAILAIIGAASEGGSQVGAGAANGYSGQNERENPQSSAICMAKAFGLIDSMSDGAAKGWLNGTAYAKGCL